MTREELKENLLKLHKIALVEMILEQWEGLQEMQELISR